MRVEQTLAELRAGQDNAYDRHKAGLVWRLLAEDWRGRTALDLGSGAGPISLELVRRGARVTGVERVPARVAAARLAAARAGLEHRLRFVEGDVCELELGERFDLLVAKDVLEHVDEERFMARVGAHARADSRLLLATHNACSLQFLLGQAGSWALGRGRYLGMDPEHLRLWGPRSLAGLLGRHGWRPLAWAGGYHLPYRLARGVLPLAWLERLPLHLLEERWGLRWPFDRCGWVLMVLAGREPAR
ncbi:MAG TPA: class I SAM-dependent methyltransferase [Myxococcota bacterium]|nr:class I SAM-dependent methyltransferase [Myxococcota bacterium]HRY94340.1 class I SAM-dependent methyltransferase [Myxococcota bacterium]HSA21221.1 class I SAM-dependent methyltransferase [Myxococcota bacterium]